MVHVRHMLSLCLLFVFIVPLAACGGGGEPVAFADIPVFPDATPLEPGTNTLADTVGDSFRQAVSQENVQVDMELYTLPADASWEEIQAFYTEQIAGDWEAETALTQDTEAFKTIGWTRGGLASEQGLAIGYGPPLLGNSPFLMVAMFSE